MEGCVGRRGGLSTFVAALALGAIFAATTAAAAPSNDDCLACHADRSLTMERRGRPVPLFVEGATFAASAHRALACIDCHEKFDPESQPHRRRIPPVDCSGCHSDAPEKHPFHAGVPPTGPGPRSPSLSCSSCHGTHDVAPIASPDFPFRRSRLVESCGRCHAPAAGRFASSAHGQALQGSTPGAPDCLTCHQKPITATNGEEPTAGLKIAQEKICLSCHLDNPEVRARMAPKAGFIAAYEKSVHGAALLGGNAGAANCVDCHGSHDMRRGNDSESRVSKARIPGICARCHADIAAGYAMSAHAAALRKGSPDAPVCTSCHGEHTIQLHTDPDAPVAPGNVSAQVCSPCHSSVRLSTKYEISSDRFKTFSDSYHGLAISGGSVKAANCASCHGAHDIRPAADPNSTVSKAKLIATCGKCHPGANQRFAVGDVHVRIEEKESPALYWIATVYVGLIVVTIGAMLLHNLLDFIRKSVRRRKLLRGEIQHEGVGHALYLRMTVNERLQHASLMISFTLLVATGFMLSYPDSWWVSAIRGVNPRVFDLRSLIHRIAAVVMVAAGVWHFAYVAATIRGRRLVLDLFPARSDLRDVFATLAYNLGLSKRRAEFGRFGYVEKSEYWALVWGTGVMAATGMIMWFENRSIGLLTKLGWDIARTIHFYEAWLAALAILVWHVYFVVFNPDTYPMNMAWLTGRLTEAEMAEDHPKELADLRREDADAESKT